MILVFLGSFWMLESFGFIQWSLWSVMYRLWPLILVVIGINIIFDKVKFIRLITWGLFFILVIVFGFYQQGQYKEEMFVSKNSNLVVERRAETKNGQLNMILGGADIEINSTNEKLLKAHIPNPHVQNQVLFNNGNKTLRVDLRQIREIHNIGNNNYNYEIELNRDIVWDIEGEIGAAKGSFDLRDLNINEINLDVGAAQFDLMIGKNSEKTKIDIDGGATKIDITLPEEAGVKAKINGVLKESNMENLGWIKKDDFFITPNYEEAKQKIDINVDLAVGQLNIKTEK